MSTERVRAAVMAIQTATLHDGSAVIILEAYVADAAAQAVKEREARLVQEIDEVYRLREESNQQAEEIARVTKERDYWKQQCADQMIRPCHVAHHEDQEILCEQQAEEIARLERTGDMHRNAIAQFMHSTKAQGEEIARLRADLTQEMAGHEETMRASNAYHEKRESVWAERVQAAVAAERHATALAAVEFFSREIDGLGTLEMVEMMEKIEALRASDKETT